MEPINFEEANVVYGSGQSEYTPLPGFKKLGDNKGEFITKWKLSDEEMELVQKTGCIYLSMLTFNKSMQPVSLSVESPI